MRERTRHAARGAEDGHLRAAGLWCRTTWQNDIDHSIEKFAKNDYGYAFDNRRRCARLEKGLFRQVSYELVVFVLPADSAFVVSELPNKFFAH